jgi:ribonuclease G
MYEDKQNESLLGNIYKGKVVNILPGMDAAFIEIGLKKNAYLYKDDLLSDKFLKEKKMSKKEAANINKILKKGEEILVQISREPIGEKNISVTTDISLPGKYMALIPKSIEVNVSKKIRNVDEKNRLKEIGKTIMSDGNGMILRTFAENISEEEIEKEYKLLSALYKQIEQEYNYSYAPKLLYKSNSLVEKIFLDYVDSTVDEIYVEDKKTKAEIENLIKSYNKLNELKNVKVVESTNIFEMFNIQNQIDMLFDRKVELQNGGSIFIDVTEAMTVIDVNSGKFIGNDNMEETALTLNLAALNEIARQIKLRNLSGIIIIDFIDIKKQENINLLLDTAKQIFKSDKAKTNVVDMTKLNLMEITRKKDKENFYNLMTKECDHCKGSGKISSKIQVILKIEGIVRKIKINTSCEAVIISVGSILYTKIMEQCEEILRDIESAYKIKIYLKENKEILTEEIIIEKMGKLDYINSIL